MMDKKLIALTETLCQTLRDHNATIMQQIAQIEQCMSQEDAPPAPEIPKNKPAELSFTDVQNAFFDALEHVKHKIGVQQSAALAAKILTKYTGGKPLSSDALPREQWPLFLASLKKILEQIDAQKGGAK